MKTFTIKEKDGLWHIYAPGQEDKPPVVVMDAEEIAVKAAELLTDGTGINKAEYIKYIVSGKGRK